MEDNELYYKAIIGVSRNNNITRDARALYSVLCTFRRKDGNYCWPTNEQLSGYMSMPGKKTKLDTITKWLQELEEHKVVRLEYKRHETGGHIFRKIYMLHDYRDKE